MRTYYEILGIRPDVPQEIISAVYKTWMQALRVHPDLGGDEDFAKEVNEAYETLRDPHRREVYDRKVVRFAMSPYEVREYRKAPRFNVDAEIAYSVAPFDKWNKARVMDASAIGLKVKSNQRLEVGDNISIAFQLSVDSAREAAIKWTKMVAKDQYECGVEFFHPIPDILVKLGCLPVDNKKKSR